MLYRSIRAHYSAAASLRRILGSGNRPADRTQGETGENANDPEGEGHARKSCSVRKTEQEGDNYAEVFRVFFYYYCYCLSKAFFSTFKEETTSCTYDHN